MSSLPVKVVSMLNNLLVPRSGHAHYGSRTEGIDLATQDHRDASKATCREETTDEQSMVLHPAFMGTQSSRSYLPFARSTLRTLH
jgi:hypothetical protein